jgi:hypothetical protein
MRSSRSTYMLVALLVLLGVDLIVVVGVLAMIIARRRWLKHQPGDFPGAIRVAGGDVDGLGPKWKRGHGRWVRDVLVWSKAPFMLRNELVPVDRVAGEHAAERGGVKRLGENPIVVELVTNGATVQVAAKQENRGLAVGPLAGTATGAPRPTGGAD